MKDNLIKTIAWKIHPSVGNFYVEHPQYCNFALVGATGVILQYVITAFLLVFGFPWWLAMFFGILAAFNSNYFFNKGWVFKKDKLTRKQRKDMEKAIKHLEEGD